MQKIFPQGMQAYADVYAAKQDLSTLQRPKNGFLMTFWKGKIVTQSYLDIIKDCKTYQKEEDVSKKELLFHFLTHSIKDYIRGFVIASWLYDKHIDEEEFLCLHRDIKDEVNMQYLLKVQYFFAVPWQLEAGVSDYAKTKSAEFDWETLKFKNTTVKD
jgi:hypothetical protein